MNKSLYLVLLSFIFTTCGIQAQEYTVKGQIIGIADTTINLANYFGKKLYFADTTYVDSKGRFEFKPQKREDGGKYALVIPGPKYFDLIVGDDDIELTTNTEDLVANLEYKESKNNQVFLDYIQFINEKMQMRGPFNDCMEDSTKTDDQKEVCREAILSLNEEVIAYQNNLISTYPNLLVAKMVKMTMEVEIPDDITDPKLLELVKDEEDEEKKEKKLKYMWYKDHFWDNVDLSDDRLVKDQAFDRVVEKYATTVIPQTPDSVMVEADRLINKVMGKPNLFKYIVHKFTYTTESSKVMCMDRAFVHMIDTYYKTGMVDWLEDEKLAEIIQASDDKKPTLCGEIAPNVILPDTTEQNWINLHQIESPYTIVAIWESSCGHCKKEMPKLKEVFNTWKDSLTVFAIGNDHENADWIEFIRDKELDGWIHVSDNPQISTPDSARTLIYNRITTLESLNFRASYNIKSTPQIFLLDENKEIIAKQLSADQVDDFMKHLTGMEEKEENIPEIKQERSKKARKEKANKTVGRRP